MPQSFFQPQRSLKQRKLSDCTWWFIPLSKWVTTPVISGLTPLIPFITRVVTHLLSGMSHQVGFIKQLWLSNSVQAAFIKPIQSQIPKSHMGRSSPNLWTLHFCWRIIWGQSHSSNKCRRIESNFHFGQDNFTITRATLDHLDQRRKHPPFFISVPPYFVWRHIPWNIPLSPIAPCLLLAPILTGITYQLPIYRWVWSNINW